MKKIFLIFLLFLMFGCNNPKQNIINVTTSKTEKVEKYTFFTYGLNNGIDSDERIKVCKKWHIYFLSVADCEFTQKFKDSIDNLNAKTTILLEQKYGKNWQTNFNTEIYELEKLNLKKV